MRSILHLVRRAADAPPAAIVAGTDTLAVLDDEEPGRVLDLIFEHDAVVLWGSATGAIQPEQDLDLTGEICPFTFVLTKLRLEQLPTGARLRVLVDHEPATRNVPRSLTDWGQEVDGVEALPDRRWAIHVIKRR